MKARPLNTSPSNFGLLAWLEETRVALPLKGVECRFQITGGVATVELDQIYHQDTARPLDCTYTFPLPADAAVYRCELHVNGRVIRARVEEKVEANRIFQEQKAAGWRAALVETERANIFTLTLGNVQPDDVIVVRFAWFQMLDRAAAGLRLLVPACPGIRYIPGKPLLRAPTGHGTEHDTDQVPDASRITPPRIDALHPDAAYFFIEGWLAAADAASGSVSSPTHAVRVREVGETIMIELAEGDAVPDRDFVLVWNEPKEKQIVFQGWHWKETEEIYALVQIRAPEKVNVASDFSQDFYFLVDRSGSMQGVKWTRTCEALHAFVKLLGKQDRVWITLFESDFQDFAEAPIPAPDVLADAGFQRMKALGVAGGTNLLPAAEHLIKQIARHSVRRRTSVVLITDGQVGNEEQIIRAFRQTPKVTIHTFGIDTAVNDSFLKSLARQYRGRCWLQTPDDDMVGTIATLGDQLRRPVITELTVNSPWFAAADTLPDLYAKEIVTLAVRGVQTAPVEIRGRYPDGSEYRAQIELKGGSEAVKLLWAKEHIAALLPDHREAAILEAKKHNLLCEGAAFIAWDETEQVDVAQEEMVQPSLDNLERSRVIMQSGGWAKAKEFQDIIPDSMPRGVKTLRKLRASPPSHQIERSTWLGQFIDAFAGWLGGKRSKPLEQRLKDPVDLIVEIRSGVLSKALSDALEPRIGQVMAGSRDALLEWTKRCRPAFQELCRIREMLVARKLPQELVDRLLTWTVQAGEIDDARLHQLRETLLAISNRPPFSAQAEIRLWQSFLMKDSHLERVTE